jgi:phage terminase large subunit-like protein
VVRQLAAWRYFDTWTTGLIPALRISSNPQVIVTTTPRPIPLLRDLLSRDDGSVVVTRGSTFDNEANLSPQALAEMHRRYDGTRIGRQELMGELIDDVEGAL